MKERERGRERACVRERDSSWLGLYHSWLGPKYFFLIVSLMTE